MQDYLKTISHLREESLAAGASGQVAITTQMLARRLGVAPPSATAMIKKLASQGLVQHAPYHGVELTPAGEKIALSTLR